MFYKNGALQSECSFFFNHYPYKSSFLFAYIKKNHYLCTRKYIKNYESIVS